MSISHPYPLSLAIPLSTIAPKMEAHNLAPGAVLVYRGDNVPYVQAKHLISKGSKAGGKWLLPALMQDGKWTDLPGNTSAEYVIHSIERSRTGKNGKPLADIVWITTTAYPNAKIGLGVEDVCVKFAMVISPVERQIIAEDSHGVLHDTKHAWESEIQSEGW